MPDDPENASAFVVRPAHEGDESAAVALWHACELVAPYNNPVADFRFARAGGASDVLVDEAGNQVVVGTVMVGHDGHRGWLYYVAADPDRRNMGIGRELVRAAEKWLRERGVRKVQLLVRAGNSGVVSFYERIGFGHSDVVVMQRWLDGTT